MRLSPTPGASAKGWLLGPQVAAASRTVTAWDPIVYDDVDYGYPPSLSAPHLKCVHTHPTGDVPDPADAGGPGARGPVGVHVHGGPAEVGPLLPLLLRLGHAVIGRLRSLVQRSCRA